ncbi:MAG: phosphopantetheine-binding protein [Thermoanaerobaculia bacterium]
MRDWTRETLEQAVFESLRHFCTDADRILPAQDLQKDLGLDSVEMVELTTLLARRFGLSSRRIHLDDVLTVAELADRVEQNLITVEGR